MYHLRGSAWTTLEIRDEPAHVPGCFKMFTGKAVKYRGKPGRRPEQPCHHRDAVGAIPAHSGNILKPCAMQTPVCPGVRPVEPRRRMVAPRFASVVTGIGTILAGKPVFVPGKWRCYYGLAR